MTPITDSELAAMRERCDKATPGPWEVVKVKTLMFANNGSGLNIATTASNIPVFKTYIKGCDTEADLEFAARVRTDQPRCLDHIEAQDDEIARLKAELKLWRPLTPEEAEQALDEAEAIPMSPEEIESLVRRATDPATICTNDEQAQMAAEIARLRAEVDELRGKLDRVTASHRGR